MKILVVSEDHLGLNSRVNKSLLTAPYFTVVDYQDNKITKVKNIENNLGSDDLQEFGNLIADLGITDLICAEISAQELEFFEEQGITVRRGQEGRIADVMKKFT